MSGDHIETCKYIALKTGIILKEEINQEGIAITGNQFIEAVEPYSKIFNQRDQDFRIDFTDQKRFDDLKKKLKVLARATSEEKYVFVSGVKQKGGLIGMTGDSIADAHALRKADVGLCMGSGCDVAKDCSDLVIIDNNFLSIHKSIKWGRAVFENVRKFL